MNTKTTEKLQAAIAHAGFTSRRKAEALIEEGKVKVNGQVATIGQRVSENDTIEVNGQTLKKIEEKKYFLINKPVGVISTTDDELNRKTVLSLVPIKSTRLYPVGRLDKDSQGLMLLTNDGQLAYKLTHPKFEITKTYQLKLDRPISDKALEHLSRGVKLSDGFARPLSVKLVDSDDQPGVKLSIEISEGRNHQVRRMLERVGYEVTQLIRTTMGPFSLEQLNGREYLELSKNQVLNLFH